MTAWERQPVESRRSVAGLELAARGSAVELSLWRWTMAGPATRANGMAPTREAAEAAAVAAAVAYLESELAALKGAT